MNCRSEKMQEIDEKCIEGMSRKVKLTNLVSRNSFNINESGDYRKLVMIAAD